MRTGFTNRPGVEYEADKLDRLFAEDLQELADFVNGGNGSRPVGIVYRDEVHAFDFTVTNFIIDGTWRDLDLSSIIPFGAKGVLIRSAFNTSQSGSILGFRKNGFTNTFSCSYSSVLVAGGVNRAESIVGVDSDRKIEYLTTNGHTYSSLNLVVLGWFI
jgi:hypothetical protein